MNRLIMALLVCVSVPAVAGNCDYPDELAKDGSICGARAASVRAGGYTPPPEYAAPVVNQDNATQNGDFVTVTQGYNTFPRHFYFKCNGDMNIEFIGGNTEYSAEKDEKFNNFYDVLFIHNNHLAGDVSHTFLANSGDDYKLIDTVNAQGNGSEVITGFPHVVEFGKLTVNFKSGKAVSASFRSDGDTINYQCKAEIVDNPWTA